MKKAGSTTFGLRAERRVSHAGAPCEGYYDLVEYTSKDRTDQINTPSMFKLLGKALGGYPPFESEFEVTVSVKVTKTAKPSRRRCHNTWPAHFCPLKNKKKRSKRS